MSFPAPTLAVRSGFNWWEGVGGGRSLEATGYFDRTLGARLISCFSGQRQLLRTQERWSAALTPAAAQPREPRLPWPRGRVTGCHLVVRSGFHAASLSLCTLVFYRRPKSTNARVYMKG